MQKIEALCGGMMMVSISQGSKIFGVCTKTIYHKIRAGVWPSYRLGPKALRIDVEEIKNLTRLSALAEKK